MSESDRMYPEHNPMLLEPHYCRHISAMTSEALHDKADIAIQLAWRDKTIEELRARVVGLEQQLSDSCDVEAEQQEACIQLGDDTWHDGPGWYYWDREYQDEGSIGAFTTKEEAVAHGKEAGYTGFVELP